MSERVQIMRLRPGEFAARVHDGDDTTNHHVVVSQAFTDDLLIPDVDPAKVAEETIHYLLDREPGDAIPHEVDLDHIGNHDQDFLPELRNRLGGRPITE